MRQIGEGAMGVVWAAVNELSGREVALKLLIRSTADMRLRLVREAKACGSLRHRNIIEVLDVGQDDNGDPFLVMPLLQGETLAELIERQFRLEVPFAAQIGRDIARALDAAHSAKIIHRDLKPANIFLHQEPGSDGLVVKVLDFGVSKNLAAQEVMATVVGGLVGSPAYMSPEQLKAARDMDHRTDIWSIGVVLFEMLAGRRPFQGEPQEIIAKIMRGEVPRASKWVRHLDPSLDALVSHCLQIDRDRRMSSAAELAKLLNNFTSSDTSQIFVEVPKRDSATVAAGDGKPARNTSPSPQDASRSVGGSPSGAPAKSGEVGNATEKFHPSVLANMAKPRDAGLPAAPQRVAITEASPTNAEFVGSTMPLRPQEVSKASSQSPPPAPLEPSASTQRGPESAGAASVNGSTTERLDPSHFMAVRRSPAPGSSGNGARASASEMPPSAGNGVEHKSGRDRENDGASTPGALATGGTVKIPLKDLPNTAPLPQVAIKGTLVLPAPQSASESSALAAARGSNETGASGGEGLWSSVPAKARMALLAGMAALVVVVGIAIYVAVKSPSEEVPVAESRGESSETASAAAPEVPAPPAPVVSVSPVETAVPSAQPSVEPTATGAPTVVATAQPEPPKTAVAQQVASPSPQPPKKRLDLTPPWEVSPAPKPPPKPQSTALKPCGKLIKTNCIR